MNSTVLYFDIVSYASLLCIFICTCVFFLLVFYSVWIKGVSETTSENSFLELVWTIIPTVWVYILCYCNVSIVTSEIEGEINNTVKVIGRQWYWSYDFEGEEYDSFMSSLVNNVDNPLILKYGVGNRLLVTASDVIHSFSVPDLGIKVDAVPGRVNQVIVTPSRVGSFVGYCSEICGTGHSYMPIVVEVLVN
uniref:cytochrome-c oxidase n=1 Tax=Cichlidogyrus sclerosus TaxID=341068 RepID=A0A3G0WUK0_9PLAT|nr:cytochrome c oxidase subunit II [Cichlidogyrus sclerosus]WRY69026.1 cytochrome c oxidase subunit 2 [Cichlidogyrus sclerosus]